MRRNKTNYLVGMLLRLRVLPNFCKQYSNNFEKAYRLWVIKAEGYLMPNNCIARTNIISRKNHRISPIIENKILAARINLKTLGKPEFIFSEKPNVFKFILDGFLLNKQTPVIDLPLPAGFPTVVTAQKWMASNPQIFFSWRKLQGLIAFVNYRIETSCFPTRGGNIYNYIVGILSQVGPNNYKV